MPQAAAKNTFLIHDHQRCATRAMKLVTAACADHGLRLTEVRQRVMEILLEQHRALGAYDILERLKAEGFGSQPPVVYRALDFLVMHGFAHRLERLNAFMACAHPGPDHQAMFLICEGCNHVAEASLEGLKVPIRGACTELGFKMNTAAVEILGTCPECRVGEG